MCTSAGTVAAEAASAAPRGARRLRRVARAARAGAVLPEARVQGSSGSSSDLSGGTDG